MTKYENCELVTVEYSDDNDRIRMGFYDEVNGDIKEITWNKKKYDTATHKWLPNEEQELRVADWSQDYFDCWPEDLSDKIGVRKDVYEYAEGKFSLWEKGFSQYQKFPEDMVGELLQGEIQTIEDDGVKIVIAVEIDGEQYGVNMNYSDYIDSMKKYIPNAAKKKRQFERFEKKFGVPFDEAEDLKGKQVFVEIKKFNKHTFGDIKNLTKKK